MSTSSGACFDKNLDALTLFTAVIRDILTETLGIRKMVDGCTKLAIEGQFQECRITSFGPCAAKSMFAKAMQSETGLRVTLHEDLAMKLFEAPSAFGDAPRTSKKPKLAIVGMAGRFPNAADHEKFWDLLEAGLDVHKRVCHIDSLCMNGADYSFQRYLKIGLTWTLIMTPPEKSAIPVTPLLAALLMSLGCLTHDSSICLLAKQHKPILCTAWVWQALTRPSKWLATYPTERRLLG